ncbi:Adenosine kinase [Fragariocoptes setiger]|uniref:Adenosine kinase n=1 Tax=Fragariocoptes setiger TaxID=1670756 RepID=A0ABQ7S933_9ACAR|nr:Adenosine kinase [Fragariocoptes setiger]
MAPHKPFRVPAILGLCNPLLDISAYVENDLLEKYKLEPNNVILAGEEHKELCSELVKNYTIDYTAGGSAQNVMRVAAGILKSQKVDCRVMFTGGVGKDEFGDLMAKKAQADGVETHYMITDSTPTGTCAVLLTEGGKNRSLCAFLGASQKFSHEHLVKNWDILVRDTDIIYISGFLLAITLETFVRLGKHVVECSSANKTLCFNLSAPYVSEVFGDRLIEVMPYFDIVFGNDTEAQAYARLRKFPDPGDIVDVAKRIASEPTLRNTPRIVVITQGEKPIIVAQKIPKPDVQGEIEDVSMKQIPCKQILESELVDTNGAGDAFAGGFLSQYIQNASIEKCVEVGSYAAREIIKQSGIVLPDFSEIASDKV